MSDVKHKAKKIVNGFGRITGYVYRGVKIKYCIWSDKDSRYSFDVVDESGQIINQQIATLPLVKSRIDKAFTEGRMK